MASKSIGELNAKVTANAEQFVQEFNRADNEARRASSSIDKEVTKLTKTLERKFGLADIGKDLLRGFGVGSGFEVMNLAIDKVGDLWKDAQEEAKNYLEVSEKIMASMREITKATHDAQFGAMFDPKEQLAKKKSDLADIDKKIGDTSSKIAELNADLGKLGTGSGGGIISGSSVDPLAGKYGYGHTMRGVGDIITDQAVKAGDEQNALIKERIALLVQIRELTDKVNKATTDQLVKETKVSETLGKLHTDYDGVDEAMAIGSGAASDLEEEMNKQALAFKDMGDPLLKYGRQMEDIAYLQKQGKLTADQATSAIAHLNEEMAKETNGDTFKKLEESIFGPGEKDIENKIKKQADEAANAAHDLGWAFSSAFEDAVIGGGKLRDVVRGLEQDLERMILRQTITKPMGDWVSNSISSAGGISGIFKGIGSIFGFADGGRPPVGRPSLVGENGPELFVPDAAGTVVPNGQLGGGGGKTFFIDARGADRSGLALLAQQIRDLNGSIEYRSVAAVMKYKRGAASSAF